MASDIKTILQDVPAGFLESQLTAAALNIGVAVYVDSNGKFAAIDAAKKQRRLLLLTSEGQYSKGGSATYGATDGVIASGDTAQAARPQIGWMVNIWLADGETIAVGDQLCYTTAGQFVKYTGDTQAVDEGGSATYDIITGLNHAKLEAFEAVDNSAGGAPARLKCIVVGG